MLGVWLTVDAWRRLMGRQDDRLAEIEAHKRTTESLAWYRARVDILQSVHAMMRNPERKIVCDVLANGCLLPDPDGVWYGLKRAALAALGEE